MTALQSTPGRELSFSAIPKAGGMTRCFWFTSLRAGLTAAEARQNRAGFPVWAHGRPHEFTSIKIPDGYRAQWEFHTTPQDRADCKTCWPGR